MSNKDTGEKSDESTSNVNAAFNYQEQMLMNRHS
jgi:hypothetical protein